jgi:hypothetical protein
VTIPSISIFENFVGMKLDIGAKSFPSCFAVKIKIKEEK